MGLTIKGEKVTKQRFAKLEERMGDAAQGTVDRSVAWLMKRSQFEVPKNTGLLANSAFIRVHDHSGPRRSSGARYGDAALNTSGESYAAAVHEILKASHAPPTKAKYVEGPLLEGIPVFKNFGKFECRKQVRKTFP
jgi:hypothetical protein